MLVYCTSNGICQLLLPTFAMYYLSPRVFRYSVLFYEKTSLFTHTHIHTDTHESNTNDTRAEEKKREEKRKKDRHRTRHELFSLVCLDLGADERDRITQFLM